MFSLGTLNIWIYIISWILTSSLADISNLPERSATNIITGSHPGLNLSNSSVCANFSEKTGINFQRLTLHNNILYVGGTNRILQISLPDFTLDQNVTLGPYEESLVDCPAPLFCKVSCDSTQCNDNKIRLILPHREQLLVCGSGYFGTCDILTLGNISVPFEPNPDRENLKCTGQTTPQIAKHGGRRTVASIYVSDESPTKDLLYLGSHHESEYTIKTFYPPRTTPDGSQLRFYEIADSQYASAVKKKNYIISWTTEEHGFVLWSTSDKRTKLVRLCHSTFNEIPAESLLEDENYGESSYTETFVSCGEFNNTVIAYYTNDTLYLMMSSHKNRVLCSVSIAKINEHLNEVRNSCLQGESDKALRFSGACRAIVSTDQLIRCGAEFRFKNFFKAVNSTIELMINEEFEWPGGYPEPTAFAVTSIGETKVAFFGTKTGLILKTQIGKPGSTFSEKVKLHSGSPILTDIAVDEAKANIYAMTAHEVYQISVSQCEQYESCDSCMNSSDPHCGWCVLKSTCTTLIECGSDHISHWMTTVSSAECPYVFRVEPSALSISSPEQLSLQFGGNPLPNVSYVCDFVVGGKSIGTSPLDGLPDFPTCKSPVSPPSIAEGSDYLYVSVEVKANDSVVAEGNIYIFDCSMTPTVDKDSMCGSCVTSEWNCKWCVETYSCAVNCTTSTVLEAEESCPAILEVLNKSTAIPVGKPHHFEILTKDLAPGDYECAISVCNGASEVIVRSRRFEDIVTCSITSQKLICDKEDSTVSIALKSGNYFVDFHNKAAAEVNLFNCTGERAECGLCIIAHDTYSQCVWCETQGKCITQDDCIDGGYTDIESCPAATIDKISPLNGPMSGGTEITIDGTNLATNHEEIINVFVRRRNSLSNDVKCILLPEKYIPSNRIVCQVELQSHAYFEGKVHVQINYTTGDIVSKEYFEFKNVSVRGYEPKYALNGTKLKFTGTNLNVGNAVRVKISKNGTVQRVATCEIREEEYMICAAPEIPVLGSYQLTVIIDGFVYRASEKLEYVQMPTIERLKDRDNLISFYSGGLVVEFVMTSVRGIQTVILSIDNGKKEQNCRTKENSIICPIPSLDVEESHKRLKRSDDQTSTISQEDAAVSAKLTINNEIDIPLEGDFALRYVVNPKFDSLPTLPCRAPETSDPSRNVNRGNGNTDESKNATEHTKVTVQLTGKDLDAAAEPEDYSIVISRNKEDGSESVECIPSFLDSDSLICKSDASKMEQHQGHKVDVLVTVGNLSFEIASEYCPGGQRTDVTIIASIIAVVVVLVVVIIILICLHRKRVRKQKEEREQIMIMLDKLENKTRENARKAYVELQLGIQSKLADNISDSITYLPPVSCFMRALFNDWKPDHPMLATKIIEGVPTVQLSGVNEFIILLKNKEFLITFVKTLEEQRHFTVKEKGHFASLLAVCLFDDMVYFTRVMMELLSELIQKHVGKNPKLLLRRSESVVEKMVSHWLCITLYSHCIRDQAGKPLFLLTKAIHCLVNSAPCDVVANKAVNSLNEMTLLGSEVTYEAMTLQASVVKDGTKSKNFEVKVVDSDTITQVKEKIIEVFYRDRPYSDCPTPDNMQLELQFGGQGHLKLSDIDNMSHQEGNYTKINTLQHYNVPSGAEVVLSPSTEDNQAAEAGSPPPEPKKKRLYHLIHPRDKELNGSLEEDDSGKRTKVLIGNLINQPFQEIYLTRMVKSKTTVQEYVDKVFDAILNPVPISRCVKYLFQFLDREAMKHRISDGEVLHIWKNNSLLLRYWVNILKNPEFLFDVNKTAIVDSCLNVITQAFMDACTTTNHKLGQDSPSNKLLYAKDAEKYKDMVSKFFLNVSNEKDVSEDEISGILQDVSKKYANEFNKQAAALELFNYLDKYLQQVLTAVDNDSILYNKLSEVARTISPQTNGRNSFETSILI